MTMKTILSAEDSSTNRRIVRDLLEWHGYRVVEAVDGLQAIEVARQELPDLILMDIQLPHLSGYEVVSTLRADPELADVPIIAITSYAMADDERRAYESGCNDYLSKPFRPRVLVQRIQRLLETTTPAANAGEEDA